MAISSTLCISFVAINGCGSDEDDAIAGPTESPLTQTVGEMKRPEAVPAAPTAPSAGIPFVKEVGYYKDWKLTKKLTDTIAPGTTFFIKVVFSEPIQFKAADDNTARPILYYRINGKLTRFRVSQHGSGGKDFVSGDAKPLQSGTDDYICKYTVPKKATGPFVVAIGKWNTDKDGNALPAFYTHKEKLRLRKMVKKPTQPTQVVPSTAPEQLADTVSPTVLSIIHYNEGNPIAEGEPVPEGATIETKILFSERVTPAVTYTTGGKTKAYSISQQTGGVHWRGTCKPTDGSSTIWRCRQIVSDPSFSVTVTTGTTDTAGNTLAEAVMRHEISVTERVATASTPQQPAVGKTTPTHTNAMKMAMEMAGKLELKRSKLINIFKQGSPGSRFDIFVRDWDAELATVNITRETSKNLWIIYRQESPNQMSERAKANERWLPSVLVEYFRLRFLNPEKNEAELLELFRQSTREGKTSSEILFF